MRQNSGAIAQLGERLNGIQEVGGSIPLGSTSSSSQASEKFVFSVELGSLTPLEINLTTLRG